MMLLGEEFGAAQAQAWGLVWDVVPDDELDAAARRVCERLGKIDPRVARRFKRVLNEVGLGSFQSAVEAENRTQRELEGKE